MRIIFIYISFLFFINCNSTKKIKVDLDSEIIIPKSYSVNKTTEKIEIDGKDDELIWQKANYSDDFIDIEGIKTPSQKTNVKMLWDEDNLYVFAKIFENHIWGDITERDQVIYYNNDFEVFINPNKHVFSYGEIEINALGTEWDLYLNKPYRLKGKEDSSWNIEGLKSAIHINGTLNDPRDIDNYWTVEMAIPLKEISKLKDPFDYSQPKVGDVWRINFSRVNWDHDLTNGKYSRKKINGKYLPEYNWVWSNQGVINMHVPENWGFLTFSNSNSEVKENYETSNEINTEQVLYAFFRKITFKELKYLKELKENEEIQFETIIFNNQEISCSFLKTESGYIISAIDKKNNIKFSISQDGLIKKY